MKHITDSLLAQAMKEAFEAGKRGATSLVADGKATAAIGKAVVALGEERNAITASQPAELERLRERISRIGLDVDRALRGEVNTESPMGTGRLQAVAALAAGPAGSGGWQAHAEDMERERDHYRQRAQTMHEHQQGQVWYWQGDGGDNLDSIVNSLPVVIRADQLRALLAGGVQALSAGPAVDIATVGELQAFEAWYKQDCAVAGAAAKMAAKSAWQARAALAASPTPPAERWNPLDGGNPETALQLAAVIAHRDAQQQPSTPDGEPSNVELRGLWYGAGGSFHGPSVETGTMPEAKLLPFLRELGNQQFNAGRQFEAERLASLRAKQPAPSAATAPDDDGYWGGGAPTKYAPQPSPTPQAEQSAPKAAPGEPSDRAAFFAWWDPYQLPEYWAARIDVVAWHAWQAAMTHAATKAAPQQEAQEPVMIYHGRCTIDCGEHGHHDMEMLRMIPAGSKLYTAPQLAPAPLSERDAPQDIGGRMFRAAYCVQEGIGQDAARYRFMTDDHADRAVRETAAEIAASMAVRGKGATDAAIDAALAAQGGQ